MSNGIRYYKYIVLFCIYLYEIIYCAQYIVFFNIGLIVFIFFLVVNKKQYTDIFSNKMYKTIISTKKNIKTNSFYTGHFKNQFKYYYVPKETLKNFINKYFNLEQVDLIDFLIFIYFILLYLINLLIGFDFAIYILFILSLMFFLFYANMLYLTYDYHKGIDIFIYRKIFTIHVKKRTLNIGMWNIFDLYQNKLSGYFISIFMISSLLSSIHH